MPHNRPERHDVSNTPEHDKIDELRSSNPLATNLAHLLLHGRGWVLENKLSDPPVRIPVSRLAAALLGVDADAYRTEVDARFGIPAVPQHIAEVVLDWSQESAVLEQIRALDEEVTARAKALVSAAAAESPIAAAVAVEHPSLLEEGTVLAAPGPEVDEPLRGTLLGAAVELGLIDAGDAYTHPAFGTPLPASALFGDANLDVLRKSAPEQPEAPQPSAFADAEPFPSSFPGQTPFDRQDPFTGSAPVDVPQFPDEHGPAFPVSLDPVAPAPIPDFPVVAEPFHVDAPLVQPSEAAPWDGAQFGFSATDFEGLGVTPPDETFQFGSYDLGGQSSGEDYNAPLIELNYDVNAPVEGLAEAESDEVLQARAEEALAYLTEPAPAAPVDVPAPTTEETSPAPEPDAEPTWTFPEASPAPAAVSDAEQAWTFPAATPSSATVPSAIDGSPLPLPVPPAAPIPAFDDVIAPAEQQPETFQHFDLLNVPDEAYKGPAEA